MKQSEFENTKEKHAVIVYVLINSEVSVDMAFTLFAKQIEHTKPGLL